MRLLIPLVLISLSVPSAIAQIELRTIVTGLDQPIAITHAGDSRLFVTLQPGRIVIVDAAGVRDFLNIESIVRDGGERGLLSVAFHPGYQENGFFYVYYTDADGDIVIARYQRSSDPDRADPNSRQL
ncbi:MAG TPA: PQQ-dependent sugar dehydrogenase, partial [Thermoanaerobaculia bacterium]|nr:PQQ-dependent sugar dehydrogenase [Thermoanaerobaculia bacterium]